MSEYKKLSDEDLLELYGILSRRIGLVECSLQHSGFNSEELAELDELNQREQRVMSKYKIEED